MLQEMPRDIDSLPKAHVDRSMPFCVDHTVMMDHLVTIVGQTGRIDGIATRLTAIESRLDKVDQNVEVLTSKTADQETRITNTQKFIDSIKANWPTIIMFMTALVYMKLKGG